MKSDYYVYAYLDPRKPGEYIYDDIKFDFEPFYIGKGTGNRLFQGFKDPNNTNSKKSKINEIRNYGLEPIAIKIYDNLSENISYELEKQAIIKIGREKTKSVLVNKSKGSTSCKKIKLNEFYLKSNSIIIVNVIDIKNDFYFLSDDSKIHKDLFLKLFRNF